MYKVTLINDGVETVIHNPFVDGIKVPVGTIKKEINLTDSFNFALYMNNPGYGKIKPFKTFVNVFNIKTNKYDFEGRVLGPSERIDDSGLYDATYECEGELGYLHDSQQRHLEFRGTPLELLTSILSYHNSQVEPYKRFQVGNVLFTNFTNNLYLYLSAEEDTYDTIKEKLIDNLGGELQIRKENGVRYLDWLETIGEAKNTEIKIAKNLISMSRDIDPTQIITRLTPLGARIESTDETATDASEARLTIESVNGGLPYIDNEQLKKEFGIQGGSVTWDDVTIPSNLLAKGFEWFETQETVHVQYQLVAADLSLIGLDIDSFEVGNTHPVKNPIMEIDERLRIVGKSIDINTPENGSLTIGDKFLSLSNYQSATKKSVQKVDELQNIVNTQSQTIGVLKNEITTVNEAVNTIQSTLQNSDIPGLQKAVQDLQSAINNLNQAIQDIPVYEPATETTNGLMSSEDKIKLDRLQNYQLATETMDGLLSMFDKIKLDLITVTKAINLDELEARVTALEQGGTS